MKPYYEHAGITIYHGDCREILPSLKFDVVVTDPPYGANVRAGRSGIFDDAQIVGDSTPDLRDWLLARCADLPMLVFGKWSVQRPLGTRMILIWDKGDHVGMGSLAMPWKPVTEEIYVIGHGFSGPRTSNVLRYNAKSPNFTPDALRFHPCEKPIDLMSDLLRKCPSGTVIDPFMGSGSTISAAKKQDRDAIGIEIEEKYCEIAAKRLEQDVFTFESSNPTNNDSQPPLEGLNNS